MLNKMPDPTDIVGLSFLVITFALLGMAAFMFAQRRQVPYQWQTVVSVMGVVGLVSGLNYFLLYASWIGANSVSTAYRFVDWQLTAPLQTISFYLMLAAVVSVSAGLFWRLLVSSVVMVGAGYLGVGGYVNPTLGFLVSLAGGLYILGELYLGEASRCNASNSNRRLQSAFNAIRLIATIGWAIYPLGYFMEFLGGGVSGGAINLIYNLADFLNKVTFGLVIYHAAALQNEPDRNN